MHSNRIRHLLLTVALVALALVVSGCGAVDKQAYIKENNKIQTDLASAMNGLDPQKPETIDAARTKIDAATKKMEALDVPDDYAKPHKQLVGALKDLSDVFGELKTASASKDTAKLNELLKRLQADQKQSNEAVRAINKDRT